jgi:tyrosine-protein kinase Etk/Wzc
MTKPTDHLPMTHVPHSPPILSVPFDPRPTLNAADETTADLKGHFNTL